jgi:hypothetical protein
VEFAIFILLFVCYGYFCQGGGFNSNSRMDLTRAIVEQQTFRIDRYSGNTADKAILDGHQYCDKAPGVSFMAVPGYALAHLIGLGLKGFVSEDFILILVPYLAVVLSVSLLCALTGVLFYRLALSITDDPEVALLGTMGYALGSLTFPWATLFYGHLVAGCLLLITFYGIFRLRLRGLEWSTSWFYLFALGFVGAYAVVVEYASAVPLAIFTFYLFFTLRRKLRIVFFLAGGTLPAAILMGYNYVCFGGPISTSYDTYISRGDQSMFKGMQEGFMGLTYPKLEAFLGTTVDPYRGLLFLCPFMILALAGLLYVHFRTRVVFFVGWIWSAFRLVIGGLTRLLARIIGRESLTRRTFTGTVDPSPPPELRFSTEWQMLTAIVFLYVIYNASYIYWDGGHSLGPRHMIPMIPFLSLFALPLLTRRSDRSSLPAACFAGICIAAVAYAAWGRELPLFHLPLLVLAFFALPLMARIKSYSASLVGVSGLFMLSGTAVFPEVPYAYKNPLYELLLPSFFSGAYSLNRTNIFANNKVIGADFNSFNLGELLDLPGFLAMVPLLVFIALALLHLMGLVGRRDKVRRILRWTINGKVLIGACLIVVLFFQLSIHKRMERIERLTLVRSFQDKHGLIARYYDGIHWSGEPKLVRLDSAIDYTWKSRDATPIERPFSVEWDGFIKIERPGKYTFSTESDDGSFLWINDKMVVDNGGFHSPRPRSGDVKLDRGVHRIRIRYFESGIDARMAAFWKPPGGKREIIPAEVLSPDTALAEE